MKGRMSECCVVRERMSERVRTSETETTSGREMNDEWEREITSGRDRDPVTENDNE